MLPDCILAASRVYATQYSRYRVRGLPHHEAHARALAFAKRVRQRIVAPA